MNNIDLPYSGAANQYQWTRLTRPDPATPTPPPPSCTNVAAFVGQSGYPTVDTGQAFQIYFDLKNDGTCTWTRAGGYQLCHASGPAFEAPSCVELGSSEQVTPGQTKRFSINMRAPSSVPTSPYNAGDTHWRIRKGSSPFGVDLWIRVTVTAPPLPTSTPTRTPTPAAPSSAMGDVTCDGTVNPLDAALILQFDIGLIDALPCQNSGDVNGDGMTNAIDSLFVLQFAAGLIQNLR